MKTTLAVLCTFVAAHLLHAQTQYSHGNPTAEEQYMLELINRARANPTAEGQRLANSGDSQVDFAIKYFKVDVAKLKKDFASYPVRPPLAMNSRLLSSARRHSKDMATKNFQSHTGSDGSTITSRISDTGFKFSALSENIYGNLVSSPFYAHAGLNIDFGMEPGGVQKGLGHRVAIMGLDNVPYREVGIGALTRSGAAAESHGKWVVTQDFGTRLDSPYFLLGVAYQDSNGNNICDPGEGLPGIRVQPSVGGYFAVTSSSGGYAIPFPSSPGTASVVFSGGVLASPVKKTFSLVRENVKVDLQAVPGAISVKMRGIDKVAGESAASGGSAVFRITRTGPSGKVAVTVKRPVSAKSGIAQPSDYTITAVKPAKVNRANSGGETFVVVIPKGHSHAELKLTPKKDNKAEPTEKVTFSIVKAPAYKVAKPASVTITIKD